MESSRQCGGGSDGSARGGDTSNGASLQHWRRPPTTTLRGVGGLSSTTPHGDRRPPVQWRWRLTSSTTPHGDRSSLHQGCGRRSEVAGPQAAVTVGYVTAVAPSLAVVRELDLLHDGATVQFLLQQSLLARAQEEEEARELEEVKRMEEAVVMKMQRLEAEVMRYAGRDRSQLSDLEYAAVTLVARSDALRRRRRKKRKKQRKKKLPRAPRPRCRRHCDHQRQVLAVQGAPVPVHRQSGGHSCFVSMDLADPVSSGKYSGTFVFTAPVAEPIVMSFTVPLNGCTIVATATVVTPCSSSADCPVSASPMCCGGACVAMSCGGGGFTPDGAYDSVWDSVRPMTGKFFINYFQYQEVVGCVCMLNSWSSRMIFAQTTTTTLELKGNYTFNFFQYQEDVGCVCMLIAGSAALTIFAPTTTTTSSSS